jgi:hypothetical protein
MLRLCIGRDVSPFEADSERDSRKKFSPLIINYSQRDSYQKMTDTHHAPGLPFPHPFALELGRSDNERARQQSLASFRTEWSTSMMQTVGPSLIATTD